MPESNHAELASFPQVWPDHHRGIPVQVVAMVHDHVVTLCAGGGVVSSRPALSLLQAPLEVPCAYVGETTGSGGAFKSTAATICLWVICLLEY